MADDRKRALVVRGGWEGHSPVEATEVFIPFLRAHGYRVEIEDSPRRLADEGFMTAVDLVLQCVSMGDISPAELAGLGRAVRAGTGLAGWHGGIVDAYRSSPDYLHLVGGQFAAHPGAHDAAADDPDANLVHHRVTITAHDHPIVRGLDDFELRTEQYWVLADDYNDVLATTTQAVRPGDPWSRPVVSPAVWTRRWGLGRVFVATPGHSLDVLEHPVVRTIIERGLLWASR